MSVPSTDRIHLFRWVLIACLAVTLTFAVAWIVEAIPYFTGGPRDVPGLEGWWNIALGVGSYVFVLGLLQTLPPWLVLFGLTSAARRMLRRDFLQDPTTRTSYIFAIVVIYLFLTAIDVMFGGVGAGSLLTPAAVILSPGLLVMILWQSRTAIRRARRAMARQ
jgi:predicted lysophospholipase L1 biosynthesis ABC-type transport system permease subunit